MELITQRDRIENILSRWEHYYGEEGRGTDSNDWGSDKHEIWKQLKALDLSTATAEDVDTIIGNNSWTRLRCDECHAEVLEVVVMGRKSNYESPSAQLCISCLHQALQLIANPRFEDL